MLLSTVFVQPIFRIFTVKIICTSPTKPWRRSSFSEDVQTILRIVTGDECLPVRKCLCVEADSLRRQAVMVAYVLVRAASLTSCSLS